MPVETAMMVSRHDDGHRDGCDGCRDGFRQIATSGRDGRRDGRNGRPVGCDSYRDKHNGHRDGL